MRLIYLAIRCEEFNWSNFITHHVSSHPFTHFLILYQLFSSYSTSTMSGSYDPNDPAQFKWAEFALSVVTNR